MPRAAGWMTFPQAGQRSSSGVTSSRQWWQITKSIGHPTGSRIVDGGFMRPVCSRMTTLNMGDAPQPDFGVCARGRSFLRNLDFRSLAGHGGAGPMTVRLTVVLALLITPPWLGPPESDPSPTDWCRQSPRRAPKGTSRDQRVGRHAQRRCGIQPPAVLPANCWNIPARITSLAERVECHSACRKFGASKCAVSFVGGDDKGRRSFQLLRERQPGDRKGRWEGDVRPRRTRTGCIGTQAFRAGLRTLR